MVEAIELATISKRRRLVLLLGSIASIGLLIVAVGFITGTFTPARSNSDGFKGLIQGSTTSSTPSPSAVPSTSPITRTPSTPPTNVPSKKTPSPTNVPSLRPTTAPSTPQAVVTPPPTAQPTAPPPTHKPSPHPVTSAPSLAQFHVLQPINSQNVSSTSDLPPSPTVHFLTPSPILQLSPTSQPTSSLASVQLVEAESYTDQNDVRLSTVNAGFTGNSYVDFGSDEDSYIEWDNIVVTEGMYEFVFRYTNGADESRPVLLTINDQTVDEIAFRSTDSRWHKWMNATTSDAFFLKQGKNTVRLQVATDTGGPNLDTMSIVPHVEEQSQIVDTVPDDTTADESVENVGDVSDNTTTELVHQSEVATVTDGVDDPDQQIEEGGPTPLQTLQAESYTRSWNTQLKSINSGFSGQSYVDFGSDETSYIEWDNVDVKEGEYELIFRYANGGRDPRPLRIYINAVSTDVVAFESTDKRWHLWKHTKSAPLSLHQGTNTIRLRVAGDAGGPNLDQMIILPLGADPNDPVIVSDLATPAPTTRHPTRLPTPPPSPLPTTRHPTRPPTRPPTRRPTTATPTPRPTTAAPTHNPTPAPTKRPRPPPGSEFSIVLFPDLQKLTKDNIEDDGLDDLTKYIISQKDNFNVKMAMAVGDMVNVAFTCEQQGRWDRLLRNVHRLDQADIPFIPTCGNHDGCHKMYGTPYDYQSQFVNDKTCGRKPYVVAERNPYYRGEYSENLVPFENSWYTYQQHGIKFIIVSLRYGRETELPQDWIKHTNKILRKHSDHYGIVLTHEAHDTHREYACKNKNVKLLIQGHRHGGRKRELIKCNNGHEIQRFVFAFRHGKDEYIQEAAAARFFTFKLAEERVVMKTYSLFENRWLDDKSACGDSAFNGLHCDRYAWDHKFYPNAGAW